MTKYIRMQVEGGEQLVNILKQIGIAPDTVLEQAAEAGAKVIRDEADLRAPGPGVELEAQPNESTQGRAVVAIGPDKSHWFYQFFETGATAHEIPKKLGKILTFAGEKGQVFARRVFHPGMAARPFLRPAVDTKSEQAAEAVGAVLAAEIDRYAEGG